MASALVDSGVRRGDRVGVLLPKRLEMVAAVYGIMKAGAAYVPIDAKAPVERGAMVRRSDALTLHTPRVPMRLPRRVLP